MPIKSRRNLFPDFGKSRRGKILARPRSLEKLGKISRSQKKFDLNEKASARFPKKFAGALFYPEKSRQFRSKILDLIRIRKYLNAKEICWQFPINRIILARRKKISQEIEKCGRNQGLTQTLPPSPARMKTLARKQSKPRKFSTKFIGIREI